MAFEAVRRTWRGADDAWRRITDWERHGDHLPLTTVHRLPGPVDGVGSAFVGRTALGRLGFDDPMEVTYWQPPSGDQPGVCRIVKRGPVVTGWAVLSVEPEPGGSVVRWEESARFALAGPWLDWPTDVVERRVFGRLVTGLLDDRQPGHSSLSG